MWHPLNVLRQHTMATSHAATLPEHFAWMLEHISKSAPSHGRVPARIYALLTQGPEISQLLLAIL
jgi:hypothetical protein